MKPYKFIRLISNKTTISRRGRILDWKIVNAIVSMKGLNVKEYKKEYGIKIFCIDELEHGEDGCIFNNFIFLRKNLPSNYRKFVILHELGHYILHKKDAIAFSYSYLGYRNKLEIEADTFACMYLLQNADLEDLDVLSYLTHNGVPEKIALKFIQKYKN